jgi:5-methylcytosine-specific restriction endonuclease McrA
MAKRYKKAKIPKAVREQLWLRDVGKVFESKCMTSWCKNRMTIFDYQCGHNVPESKGGKTVLENLVPICSRCNLSMSNNFTFEEWNSKHQSKKSWWSRYLSCFIMNNTRISDHTPSCISQGKPHTDDKGSTS